MSKVAIITGGSRGIGRAIALELAKSGYGIAFNYQKSATAARSLERVLKRMGARVYHSQQDVRDTSGVRVFVEKVIQRFGKIDVLVNNAGVVADAPLYLMSDEEWNTVLDTNLKGAYNFARTCVPHMMRRKQGRIVNVASTSGLHGVPGQTNYCASKGGLIAFSKALARELAGYNITVNTVAPGFIDTEMLGGLKASKVDEYKALVPMRRFGRACEVAEVVAFLTTKASYITGQTIVVDGGLLT